VGFASSPAVFELSQLLYGAVNGPVQVFPKKLLDCKERRQRGAEKQADFWVFPI